MHFNYKWLRIVLHFECPLGSICIPHDQFRDIFNYRTIVCFSMSDFIKVLNNFFHYWYRETDYMYSKKCYEFDHMVLSLRAIKIVYNSKKKFDIILPSDIPIEESSLSDPRQREGRMVLILNSWLNLIESRQEPSQYNLNRKACILLLFSQNLLMAGFNFQCIEILFI